MLSIPFSVWRTTSKVEPMYSATAVGCPIPRLTKDPGSISCATSAATCDVVNGGTTAHWTTNRST